MISCFGSGSIGQKLGRRQTTFGSYLKTSSRCTQESDPFRRGFIFVGKSFYLSKNRLGFAPETARRCFEPCIAPHSPGLARGDRGATDPARLSRRRGSNNLL